MTVPNFIFIGPPKTGSTSLHHYLGQHPEIFMSTIKEPGFFMSQGETENLIQGNKYYSINSLSDYENLFAGVENETAYGESSTQYFYSQTAINHIAQDIPQVKILSMLRNPIERAFSEYMMMRLNGRELSDSFERVVAEQLKNEVSPRLVNPQKSYLEGGFYYFYLSKYFKQFPPENIHVIIFENFINNPDQYLREIFQFLGVDPNFNVEVKPVFNKSGNPKSKLLNHLFLKPNMVKDRLKQFFPNRIRQKVRLGVRNRIMQKPKINPDLHNRLLEIYRDDILKLQDLIKIDLSDWLKKASPDN